MPKVSHEGIRSLKPLLNKYFISAEEEEKSFLIERAQSAAQRVLEMANRKNGTNTGRGGRGFARGGRGGGRGGQRGRGRGGRGGDHGRNGQNRDTPSTVKSEEKEEETGEKRKRNIEPDGGVGAGTRGTAIPTIQPSKKMKTEDSTGSTMSTDTT